LPPTGVGVSRSSLRKFQEIYLPLVATGQRAPLQPVVATSEKCPENLSMLAGTGDWPPHQQV